MPADYNNAPIRIVQTIPGQSTGGDDDRYVASDGSVWKRVSPIDLSGTATWSGVVRTLNNGWLLP